MKIAVLGSWRTSKIGQDWRLKHQDHFQAACEALGETLAACAYQLVVAQAEEETADKYVSDGYIRQGSPDGLTIIRSTRGARTWGAAHICAVEQSDAVVIIGGTDGSHSAGMAALLAKKRVIPIGCFGGAARELLHDMPQPIPGVVSNTLNRLEPSRDPDWVRKLIKIVIDLLEAQPRILIIHGRSSDRFEVKKILEASRTEFPNLPDAVIMSEHGGPADSIQELFEGLAAKVDAAIAIVTPDDLGVAATDPNGRSVRAIDLQGLGPRARENVWVEVGWFWGRLGRDKLMILRKGNDVAIPSDLAGLIQHNYLVEPHERTGEIREFVRLLRHGRRTD